MNKIICDVCGTSYPETSAQCPICGYAKPSKAKAAPKEEGYVHVKGGRFSAANVQKRNMDKGIPPAEQTESAKKSVKSGGNMVLGITAIVLLLILIVIMAFFILKIVQEFQNNAQPTVPTDQITTQTPTTTQDPDVQILCQSVTADVTKVLFDAVGQTYSPAISVSPEDTTDMLKFASADEAVATVDADGLITAVADGQTTVTVTCGKAKLEIDIICNTTEQSTDPTETTGGEEKESLINRKDITLSKKGETWDLYSKTATVAKNKIKWASEDETIATVDGGVVTAVGNGLTTVTAEYDGKTYSCTVRCSIPDEDTDKETTQPSVDASTLKPSKDDVTLKVDGEAHEKSFYLYLQDENGNRQNVTWTAAKEGYVTIEGNKITAVKAIKQLTVSTTFEGKTYKCIVRIN